MKKWIWKKTCQPHIQNNVFVQHLSFFIGKMGWLQLCPLWVWAGMKGGAATKSSGQTWLSEAVLGQSPRVSGLNYGSDESGWLLGGNNAKQRVALQEGSWNDLGGLSLKVRVSRYDQHLGSQHLGGWSRRIRSSRPARDKWDLVWTQNKGATE